MSLTEPPITHLAGACKVDEREMANAIRALVMDSVEVSQSGHPGMPMGMADVATVLFNRFIKLEPGRPHWVDRDRFVLSAGHGSMLLYAINHLLGYSDMDAEELRRFRQLGARTAGHPEYGHAYGVETTTGPLGQGLASASGMALAERMLNARFGDELVDHFTYVIAGDGCLMEGLSQETIDFAGHLRLARLIVLWDDNAITIDGPTVLSTSSDQLKRFEAAGWHVVANIDGHNFDAVAGAIEAARADERPSFIACKTMIGRGAPTKQGTAAVHGSPLGAEEVALTREAIGWPHPPFHVPSEIRTAWRAIAQRGARAREHWQARLCASSNKDDFAEMLRRPDEAALAHAIKEIKARFSEEAPTRATRQASQDVLEIVNTVLVNTIGGSADLTGSNNTKTKALEPVTRDNYAGRYLHYGIREHAMAAVMNGMALHGGFIPYGGTFLVFSDYCRPSIRLSALMGVRVIYVMTHDSIGLGEDGPTHQPVEHLASLRAIPNLLVLRPADGVETAEAWEIALTHAKTPSVLCLSRQNLKTVRTRHVDENLSSRGAYVVHEPDGGRDITLIATGSEVEIAQAASVQLEAIGLKAAIVSAPCFELFAQQNRPYQKTVLGSAPRIGIEAAVDLGWRRWLGEDGVFVGLSTFGASAPGPELYRHFGITPEAIVGAARELLQR
jgi:transketolase